MNIIQSTILIGSLITSGYFLPINTIKSENINTIKTFNLDNEITNLSAQYKVNEQLVRKIIQCESEMYPSAINNNIDKNGKVWSSDYGPLQINNYYHEQVMNKLGLDIHNEYDSLKYGIMLLAAKGTQPWTASKMCWSKT